jgi:hypothetical protein
VNYNDGILSPCPVHQDHRGTGAEHLGHPPVLRGYFQECHTPSVRSQHENKLETTATRRRFLTLVTLVVALATIAFASNPPTTLWGCWTVKRALPTTNISGLSQKEVDRIVGTRIIYSDSCAKSGRNLLRSPGYVTTILSDREFFEYAHVPLKQLGIAGTTATKVTLSGSENLKSRFIGDTVFLGGKSPVIEVEGVFFELGKANPGKGECTYVN